MYTLCFYVSVNITFNVFYHNRSGQYILSTLFPETYDNSSEINGYAVVINNYDFGGLKETLLGRENDSKKLQDTFSGLDFDVKIYENKPKDEMLSIFKDCK